MRLNKNIWLAFGLALVVSGMAAGQERKPWSVPGCPYRKLIEAPAGSGLCQAVVFVGDRAEEDGSDLRLVSPEGRAAPFQLVWSAAGAFTIAFDNEHGQGSRIYALYYGGSDHRPAHKSLRSGLLLYTRGISPDANVNSWESAKAAIEAGHEYGAAMCKQVFDAINPFGPSENYAAVYEGVISCPADGEYTFAVSGDSACFLLIDDKLVSQVPGRDKNLQRSRRGEGKTALTLKAGDHKFKFAGFSFDAPSRFAAYWQPPGKDKLEVIPPMAFGNVSDAKTVGAETAGKSVYADFDPRTAPYLEIGSAKMCAVRFAFDGEGARGKRRIDWDFGDGITARGENVVHIYLLPGKYKATVTVESAAGLKDSWTTDLNVERLWTDWDFAAPKKIERFVSAVRDYPPESLLSAHLLALRDVLKSQSDYESVYAVDKELSGRQDAADPKAKAPILQEMGDYRLARYGDVKEADKAYADALALADNANKFDLRLGALVLAGEWKNDKNAESGLRNMLQSVKMPERKERVLVALGDLAQMRGDLKAAADCYAQAEKLSPQSETVPAEVANGKYIFPIRSALEQKDGQAAMTALDEWMRFYPSRRLDGATFVMRMKAHILLKEYGMARHLGEMYLAASREDEQGAWVSLLTAQACKELGAKDDARHYAEQVMQKWPESAAVVEAKEIVK